MGLSHGQYETEGEREGEREGESEFCDTSIEFYGNCKMRAEKAKWKRHRFWLNTRLH